MATQGRLMCIASNPYGTKSAYVDVRLRERELPPIPAGKQPDISSDQQDQNSFSYNQMFMILGIVSSLFLIIFGVLFARFYYKQRVKTKDFN